MNDGSRAHPGHRPLPLIAEPDRCPCRWFLKLSLSLHSGSGTGSSRSQTRVKDDSASSPAYPVGWRIA